MLKRFLPILMLLMLIPAMSMANTYTFTPSDSDLADLPHGSVFKWGIKWTLPSDEEITAAKITYYDIWDWTVETDHLYTHLLNTVSFTTTALNTVNMGDYSYSRKTFAYTDNDGSGDSFGSYSGQHLRLGDWNDPSGGSNGRYAIDLSYVIPSANFSWLGDGNFGFGIDPNCHYYNQGVEVEITTRSVPEPAALSLLALSLVGLVGVRREFRK